MELKDFEGAISDFSKAIEINPNYENAYVNRGISRKNIKWGINCLKEVKLVKFELMLIMLLN